MDKREKTKFVLNKLIRQKKNDGAKFFLTFPDVAKAHD